MHALDVDNADRMTCVPVIATGRDLTVLSVSFDWINQHSFSMFSPSLFFSSNMPLHCFSILIAGTCPFGRAHVDTPKGDLDASLFVGKADTDVTESKVLLTGSSAYPFGTTEAYPLMEDTSGLIYDNTAHDYMECSNKGLCDRERGQCECLPGYDGAACQRASCPSNVDSVTPGSGTDTRTNYAFKMYNAVSSFTGRATTNTAQKDSCSGHGTCMTIGQLAFLDNGNIYDLWDKDSGMGCKCDPG